MKRALWPALFVILPAAGVWAGYRFGPGLARAHRTVQLAVRVRLEDRYHLTERTPASEAFRDSGKSADALFREAAQIERTFEWGAALVGVWVGLVVAAKLWGAAHRRPSPVAVIDHASCVSCARCFAYCPRERTRWQQTAGTPIDQPRGEP